MANVADATATAPAAAKLDAAKLDNATPAGASAETAPAAATKRFPGTPRNMVAGIAMLLASVMAFTMGMTEVFFAEATAWIFGIWGGLLIYAGMLDIFRVYEITDDALLIQDDFRPWGRLKVWDWERLNRLDLLVKKNNAQAKDVEMQVYYYPQGELAQEREDRVFDAALAQLIIEKAGLKPSGNANPADLTAVPLDQKQTYIWSK
ncbi:MAG: hypothetical protein WDZ49_06920 [Litorilinea sp.]